ncbi:MAG: hypothetical protein CEN90_246 [Parcubacteria group bacterium Licking1014_17]|nr:MAG: hypothetical protein CEN90_246 [Parcubacteria group bacterium Licking1014_17]
MKATVSAVFEAYQRAVAEREKARNGDREPGSYGEMLVLTVRLEKVLLECDVKIELPQGTETFIAPALSKL